MSTVQKYLIASSALFVIALACLLLFDLPLNIWQSLALAVAVGLVGGVKVLLDGSASKKAAELGAEKRRSR